jgi:hypothetical protein
MELGAARELEAILKIFLAAVVLLVMAVPAGAQSASVWVKVEGGHCWVYTKEIVHRLAHDTTVNEDNQVIRAGHLSNFSGDIYRTVQALGEKNKKGEEGCRIYVGVEAGGSLGPTAQSANDFTDNSRIANYVAAEVVSMDKAAQKKESKAAQKKEKEAAKP